MNKIFLVLFLVASVAFNGLAQMVKIKLRADDIQEMLATIKQDMVYDRITVDEKEKAVKSCERVLRRGGASGTVEVPEKYILKYIEGKFYYFEDYKRAKIERNKLMRLVEQLYAEDKNLEILRKSNASGFSDLRRLRKHFLRELQEDSGFENDPKNYRDDELDDNGNIKPKRQ